MVNNNNNVNNINFNEANLYQWLRRLQELLFPPIYQV